MVTGVLIVEDESLLRIDVVDFMTHAGLVVYESSNADDAIALLEVCEDIHVVFTDIQMPGSMDGLKLAHYVCRHWPPIKLIITSGMARPHSRDMPAGAKFISKPYEVERVVEDILALVT